MHVCKLIELLEIVIVYGRAIYIDGNLAYREMSSNAFEKRVFAVCYLLVSDKCITTYVQFCCSQKFFLGGQILVPTDVTESPRASKVFEDSNVYIMSSISSKQKKDYGDL